jgi:hypothetical protein
MSLSGFVSPAGGRFALQRNSFNQTVARHAFAIFVGGANRSRTLAHFLDGVGK